MTRTNPWRKLRGAKALKPARRSKGMPCLRADLRRQARDYRKGLQYTAAEFAAKLRSRPPGPNRAERRKGVPAFVAGRKVFARLRHGRYEPYLYLYLDGRS